MLLLKELIDFLLLLRSLAAMRITNLCNTQTLSAAQCAENTPITYHLSISLSLSVSVSLTLSLTFPLINTLGSVCVLQIQTRGKMKKEVWLTSAVCWQQGYKGVQISSKREQWRWVRSRDVYRDPSGPSHCISHLSIPSRNRLKLFLCFSDCLQTANEVQS